MIKRPTYVQLPEDETSYVYFRDCIWHVTAKARVQLEWSGRMLNLYQLEFVAGDRPPRLGATIRGVKFIEFELCTLTDLEILARAADS